MKRYAHKLSILGGMGPEATAGLYLGIIHRCQRELHAKFNSDFPPIIINSCPVPDGYMWKGFVKADVEKTLRFNVRLLENAGADFIAIPCNSVHHFLPTMRRAVRVPILSIVEETASAICAKGLRKVLLLATKFTVNRRVYDDHLAECGISVVKPTAREKQMIERVIIRVEGGVRSKSDRARVINLVNQMRKQVGIEGVVAGCTEIPLLIKANDLTIPLFDTIDILAASAYEVIMGARRLQESHS